MARTSRKPRRERSDHATDADRGLVDEAFAQARLLEAGGHVEQAQALYAAILAADPAHGPALHRSACLAGGLGQPELALRFLTLAALAAPRSADILNDLAIALLGDDRLADAASACERALALDPARVDSRINLAAIERCRGRFDRVIRLSRQALALDPQSREARLNLAGALAEVGATAEAVALLDELLSMAPDHVQARSTRSVIALFEGRLADAWRDYPMRWHTPRFRSPWRGGARARWAGDACASSHVHVWREQGIGDEILFASMLPDLIERTRAVTLECEPRLVALFARSFPAAKVVPALDPPHPAVSDPTIDAQTAIGDLAPVLRPSLASFPDRRRYLVPDAALAASWRARLNARGPGLKVGICWRSSDLRGERHLACTRIEQWREVLGVTGVQFVNLQYDECGQELERARAQCGAEILVPDGINLREDIDATAALIEALDLVIAVPTVTYLLAGGVGAPVWELSSGVDWHCLGTPGSPWQPTVRRYWRPWNRSWEEVLSTVAIDLARLVASGRAPTPVKEELAGFAAPARGAALDRTC